MPSDVIAPGDDFAVDVEVANMGEAAGGVVVQAYIRDEFASVTQPVRQQLVGFARVELDAGERRTVTIPVDGQDLRLYDRDMDMVVEPEEVTVFAGTSSRLEDLESTSPTVSSGNEDRPRSR